MFTPILSTKLFIPPARPDLLPRARLIEQLNEAATGKLTLIPASAGFGKSTLLSQWVANTPLPTAWLSLDPGDNEPVRFMAYFIAAIQKIDAEIGVEALEILHSSQTAPYELILTNLLNEVAESLTPAHIILDDYHVITAAQVQEIMLFMIDNLPPSVHLIVASRNDPPWPLARLRARRELVEIRSNDLRFTLEETSNLLKSMLDVELSPDRIRSLDDRVEGWAAGLQMAVLSLRGREDISGFVGVLTGSHRFILDYLVEEVLDKQTKEIQDFLLRTSILDRMNASLCNALMDIEDSQMLLTQMERLNLFLVPLDNERTWYRYHQLFAELLQKQLIKVHPNQISTLHARASHWYEEAGMFREAISHAVLGEDFERAANLVELNALDSYSHNQEKALANWLELLPEEILRSRPWLCVLQAYSCFWFGPRTKVEEYLQIAEQILAQDPSDFMIPSTSPPLSMFEKKRLVGSIAIIRADHFQVEGDVHRVLEQVNIAFDNLDEDDRWRMKALNTMGCAYWALGDRSEAEKYFNDASAGYFRTGNWVGTVSNLCYVGVMQMKQGCPQLAFRTYMEAVRRATRSDGRMMPIAGFPSIKIGDLLREWNDLSSAQDHIDRGLTLAANLNQPDGLIESYICLARLRHSHNDQPGTLEALEKAELVLEKNKVDPWYLGWLDECWLRYWLSAGDLAAAVSQIERGGLTAESPLSYHHDLHHINLARVLIVQGELDPSGPYLGQAERLLGRLQEAAEKAGWVHETIKILILEGLMFLASGKKERAVEMLAQALTLAEPGGYVRIFIDEGEPIEELLSGFLVSNGAGKGSDTRIRVYADKLLNALKNERKGYIPVGYSGVSDMVEPLSERELEVMRFLNSHLSSVEIASELMVSPNTVRFHIKNIYSKLNVHSRSDAVQKAKDLRIL